MTTKSIEQAEHMSKLIREKNQREIYSDDYYVEAIRHSQKELEESLLFLQKAFVEPELFFTTAKEGLHSTRSMIYKAIDYRARDQKMGNQHDFQALLAEKMNQHLQKWVQVRGIEEQVKVEVRNPLSFPSIYCIYFNDMEVIQFNIFEQWYGVRERPLSEEEIINQSNSVVRNHEEQVEKLKKQLDDYKAYRENPWKHVKVPTDIVIILFKMKRLKEGLNKRISNTEKRIKEEQDMLKGAKDSLPYYLEKRNKRQIGIDKIVPFFEELSYRLETEQHKLY